MTPEQIKKHEQMNINNLHEAIPVEKDLPVVKDIYTCLLESGRTAEIYFDGLKFSNDYVTHWFIPVTRESIEAFLREFGEKVWDISEAYNSNIDEDIPDKQTAITELIKKFTHPAPLGDKQ